MLESSTSPFSNSTLTLSLPSSTTDLGATGSLPESSDNAKKEFPLGGQEISLLCVAEDAGVDFGAETSP